MQSESSHFDVDSITQINARHYDHQGRSLIVVEEGAYYSNSVQINADTYIRHELPQPHIAKVNATAPKDLYPNVAPAALRNSDERGHAPKCHEETRVAAQEEILDWMMHGDRDARPKRIMWLAGPAGTGKTAIMGSIADCCHEKGLLAASFFFSSSSGSPHRRSKRRFVPALSYQLRQHPGFKASVGRRILSAVEDNPALFDKSLKEQFQVPILRPLRDCRDHYDPDTVPKVILIDGLDECEGTRYQDAANHDADSFRQAKERDQLEILSVLLQAATPTFPFRVIIASRPERAIRLCLSASVETTRELFLDDKYHPDEDIALFFRSKISQIRRQHQLSSLPSSWPGEEALMQLVKAASGQFIYAATVIRFVETPTNTPSRQLESILGSRALIDPEGGANPFEPLDALYTKTL